MNGVHGTPPERVPPTADPGATGRRRGRSIDLFLLPLAAFAAVTALAELVGAANLGTAATFGQIAFAATLVWMLLHRD